MLLRVIILFSFCAFFVKSNVLFNSNTTSKIKKNVINFHSNNVDNDIPTFINNVQGAFVLNSNLPIVVQTELSNALTLIYHTEGIPLQRLKKFQKVVTHMYNAYWNVVLNFDNVTYYSQYYAYLQMNNDRILAFGLN